MCASLRVKCEHLTLTALLPVNRPSRALPFCPAHRLPKQAELPFGLGRSPRAARAVVRHRKKSVGPVSVRPSFRQSCDAPGPVQCEVGEDTQVGGEAFERYLKDTSINAVTAHYLHPVFCKFP